MEELARIDRSDKESVKSIQHALRVLNDAAKDSSDEIKQMVSRDYRHLKETFSDLKPELTSVVRELRDASGESISRVKNRIVETTRETSQKVDKSVHESPWRFIGGAAAVAALLGFFLGRKRSS
ncbi:hypothetical protein WDW86_03230 [Bdellovibrionota bacterium FG-2]